MWLHKDGPVPIPPGIKLPTSIGYAIPLITLSLVLLGFIYYIYLIQKGKLTLSETFVWILFTLLMVFIALYLLILQIMSTFGYGGFNLFDYFSSLFGLVDRNGNTPKWLMMIIMIFLAFMYTKLFHTTIKITKLKANVNTLSKEVAIMNGKLSDTLDNRKTSPKKKSDKINDK